MRSNERRPEEHELGQRATFNEQRSGEWRATATSNEVASDELRAQQRAIGDGRRATTTSGVVACSVARSCGPLGRAQQADDAGRAWGAVDRTTRSLRQHIGEPLGAERRGGGLRAASDGRARVGP